MRGCRISTVIACSVWLLHGQSERLTPGSSASASSRESPVILTVGNEDITQAEFELLLDVVPGARTQAATEDGRSRLINQIVQLKALAQEAKRRKLDRDPRTQQEMRFHTDQVLAKAVVAHVGEAVTDEMQHRYYDEHRSNFEMVEARHILIRFKGSAVPARSGQPELTEEQALAKARGVRRRILAGGEFREVAIAESDDSGTRGTGGELGTVVRGQLTAEFESAAFALRDGEISQPVHTKYGFHIVQTKRHTFRDFESVRDDIKAILRREQQNAVLEEVVRRTNVVVDDRYFGDWRKGERRCTSCGPCQK